MYCGTSMAYFPVVFIEQPRCTVTKCNKNKQRLADVYLQWKNKKFWTAFPHWQIAIRLFRTKCGRSSLTDKSGRSLNVRGRISQTEWLKETQGYQIAHVRAALCKIATLRALDRAIGAYNAFSMELLSFRSVQVIPNKRWAATLEPGVKMVVIQPPSSAYFR